MMEYFVFLMHNKIEIRQLLAMDYVHRHNELDNHHLSIQVNSSVRFTKSKNLRIRSASSNSIRRSAPSSALKLSDV